MLGVLEQQKNAEIRELLIGVINDQNEAELRDIEKADSPAESPTQNSSPDYTPTPARRSLRVGKQPPMNSQRHRRMKTLSIAPSCGNLKMSTWFRG